MFNLPAHELTVPDVRRNPSVAELYEDALSHDGAQLARLGRARRLLGVQDRPQPQG